MSLLGDYEAVYGKSARDYAQRTIGDWKNGTTQMSGNTVKRLFALVPRYMSFASKKQVFEKLWTQYSPQRHHTIEADFTATVDQIASRLKQCVVDQQSSIPPDLQNDFDWLAGQDIQAMQAVIEDMRRIEWTGMEADARNRLRVVLEDAHRQQYVQRFEHSYQVGKHVVVIIFEGAKLPLPPPPPPAILNAVPVFDEESRSRNAALLTLVILGFSTVTLMIAAIALGW